MLYDPFGRPFAIRWEKEGDEWLEHLKSALRPHGITGYTTKTSQGSAELPLPHIECRPLPESFRSHLIIQLSDTGIHVRITDEEESGDELNVWIAAINQANERLGKLQQEFQWDAVIGPFKDIEVRQALASAAYIGPLRLRPGDVFYTEHVETHAPSLTGSRSSFWSWPIIVEGRSRGYNWDIASTAALIDLHRLCALLSVAWGRCWVLRQLPRLGEPGVATIPRPLEAAYIKESDVVRKIVQVPSWASPAWELIGKVPELAEALSAHFEGLQMHHRHPSFALIAYVSSIEALGTQLSKPKRCEHCGTIGGSTERFRGALRLVSGEDDVIRLTRAVYPRRSATAHRARLHGMESTFRAAFPGFFEAMDPDSGVSFAFGILNDIRRANGSLLEGLLSGRISQAVKRN